MICDFCHASDPIWRFRAEPFVIDYGIGVRSASDADWAACEACRQLILTGDRVGLVNRAMEVAPQISGASENEVRELRSWAHDLFFRYRLADEPIRIDT
jgi:hypothetical protein